MFSNQCLYEWMSKTLHKYVTISLIITIYGGNHLHGVIPIKLHILKLIEI